ncbi:MAG: hypothetical protein WB681_10525 [Candidatus Cybelea sp.]
MQQHGKTLRPKVLAVRSKIPRVFGHNTYVYAAIAANGAVLRETDINASLGHTAVNSLYQPDREALGILRRFQIQTVQGVGPRGYAVVFDESFPLVKEARALARTIGEHYPLPIDNKMPKETPPPPQPRKKYQVELLAGSEVNTLVLATTRFLRGKTTRSELAAAVPYGSMTAVERSLQRLTEYGILDTRSGFYFTAAPWLPQLERLYDAYLRLRPELREEIHARFRLKKRSQDDHHINGLFGYAVEERVLQTLAVHGPMKRTELAAVTMLTRDEQMLRPLVKAGILTTQEQIGNRGTGGKSHGTRKRIMVSLNAAFPAYRELRAVLLALASQPVTRVRDLADPRTNYDPNAIFNTPTLLKALLLMNAVPEAEMDVASLNRLRPEHAPYTLHGRMKWMLDEKIISVRKSGHMLYYGLDPTYPAYKALKRLLDRIAQVWPDLVDAAAFNDGLKPARRLTEDRNARRRAQKRARIT